MWCLRLAPCQVMEGSVKLGTIRCPQRLCRRRYRTGRLLGSALLVGIIALHPAVLKQAAAIQSEQPHQQAQAIVFGSINGAETRAETRDEAVEHAVRTTGTPQAAPGVGSAMKDGVNETVKDDMWSEDDKRERERERERLSDMLSEDDKRERERERERLSDMWSEDDKSVSIDDDKSESILSRAQLLRGEKGVGEGENEEMGNEGRGEGGEGGQVKRVGGEGGERVQGMGEMSRTPPPPERDLPSPRGANGGGRDKDEAVTHIEPYDQRRRPRERVGTGSSWETINELEKERNFLLDLARRYKKLDASATLASQTQGEDGLATTTIATSSQEHPPEKRTEQTSRGTTATSTISSTSSRWIENGRVRLDLTDAIQGKGILVFPKTMGGKEAQAIHHRQAAHEIHDRTALQKGEQEGESERMKDEALRYYRNPSEEVPPDDLPAYLSAPCCCTPCYCPFNTCPPSWCTNI